MIRSGLVASAIPRPPARLPAVWTSAEEVSCEALVQWACSWGQCSSRRPLPPCRPGLGHPAHDAVGRACSGVDAIEFDNVDAYQNKTGLTISAATQEQFDAAIANLAHAAGFAVGLKNDLGQVGDLQPYFDFANNEQCWQYRGCNFPAPGLQAWPPAYGKAVFNVEYKLAASKFCPQANSYSYNFNSILKDVNLYDVPYTPCR